MNNLRFLHSIRNGISYYFINGKRVSKMTQYSGYSNTNI